MSRTEMTVTSNQVHLCKTHDHTTMTPLYINHNSVCVCANIARGNVYEFVFVWMCSYVRKCVSVCVCVCVCVCLHVCVQCVYMCLLFV